MNDIEYQAAQDALVMCASLLGQYDYGEFIDRIERCHAIGPILDPTLYIKGIDRLRPIQAMARAAQELAKAHAELNAIIAKENAHDHLKHKGASHDNRIHRPNLPRSQPCLLQDDWRPLAARVGERT